MKSRLQAMTIGAAFLVASVFGGGIAHPSPVLAKPNIHCHTLNRIDYWVVTGIDSGQDGNIWCVGSLG
jgi:hypothetical protein